MELSDLTPRGTPLCSPSLLALLLLLQTRSARGETGAGCEAPEAVLVGAVVGTFILTVTVGSLAVVVAWVIRGRLGGVKAACFDIEKGTYTTGSEMLITRLFIDELLTSECCYFKRCCAA